MASDYSLIIRCRLIVEFEIHIAQAIRMWYHYVSCPKLDIRLSGVFFRHSSAFFVSCSLLATIDTKDFLEQLFDIVICVCTNSTFSFS